MSPDERTVLAEDCRLAHVVDAKRQERAVHEERPPVLVDLILIGDVLQRQARILLLELQKPAGQLEPCIPVQRVDCRSRSPPRAVCVAIAVSRSMKPYSSP